MPTVTTSWQWRRRRRRTRKRRRSFTWQAAGTTNSLVEDLRGSSSGHWTIKRVRPKYQTYTAPTKSNCRQNTALRGNLKSHSSPMTAVVHELRSQSVPMSSFPNRPRSLPPSSPLPFFLFRRLTEICDSIGHSHRPYENCPVLMVCAPDVHRVSPI